MKMKKVLIYSLSIMLVAGAAISCKKTSKGKMSNEWQLEEWSEVETTVQDNGDRSVTTTTASGSSYTETEANTPNGQSTTTSSRNGTLNNFSYTIEKDGTWSREVGYTLEYTQTQGGVQTNYVDVISISNSGTWNFLGNVDEFKKNERVAFNTLSVTNVRTSTSTTTVFGTTQTQTDTYNENSTYNDGDMADIMVVVESKRKELQMESVEKTVENTSLNSGSQDTWTRSTDTQISLIQE
jgi:hypothetical protein